MSKWICVQPGCAHDSKIVADLADVHSEQNPHFLHQCKKFQEVIQDLRSDRYAALHRLKTSHEENQAYVVDRCNFITKQLEIATTTVPAALASWVSNEQQNDNQVLAMIKVFLEIDPADLDQEFERYNANLKFLIKPPAYFEDYEKKAIEFREAFDSKISSLLFAINELTNIRAVDPNAQSVFQQVPIVDQQPVNQPLEIVHPEPAPPVLNQIPSSVPVLIQTPQPVQTQPQVTPTAEESPGDSDLEYQLIQISLDLSYFYPNITQDIRDKLSLAQSLIEIKPAFQMNLELQLKMLFSERQIQNRSTVTREYLQRCLRLLHANLDLNAQGFDLSIVRYAKICISTLHTDSLDVQAQYLEQLSKFIDKYLFVNVNLAIAYRREIVILYESLGNKKQQAEGLANLAQSLVVGGNQSEAVVSIRRGYDLIRQLPDFEPLQGAQYILAFSEKFQNVTIEFGFDELVCRAMNIYVEYYGEEIATELTWKHMRYQSGILN